MTPTLPQALEAIREEIDKNSVDGHGLVSSTTAAKLLRAVELLRKQRNSYMEFLYEHEPFREGVIAEDDAELYASVFSDSGGVLTEESSASEASAKEET